MKHVVIIGNGISGITAARHIRKRTDHKITVISGETDHFFSRTALMYIYMGHMTFENTQPYEPYFWKKNRIELLRDWVTAVDPQAKKLSLQKTGSMDYDTLILATGSVPNKFGWPGQDLKGVQGLYSYQDLELMEENTKNIKRGVIVGGGLIGIEMAEMLLSRGIEVTFLVRENGYWSKVLPKEESEMIVRHIYEHHVDLRLSSELDSIIDDRTGRVKAIKTKAGEEIECQFVGLTAGVAPNISFLKDSGIELQRGIMVNRYLETNYPEVYALGDCAQFHEPLPNRRPLEQVWYTGRMMGETVARTIAGDRTEYDPGIWFNSAKFFDIEYQTYGWVWAEPKENEGTFYWEHPSGKISFRAVYDKQTRALLGINVFGFRLRHEMCQQWYIDKRTVDYVVEHLRDANFDPEFYKAHESAICEQFNREHGTNIKPRKKSWKRILKLANA